MADSEMREEPTAPVDAKRPNNHGQRRRSAPAKQRRQDDRRNYANQKAHKEIKDSIRSRLLGPEASHRSDDIARSLAETESARSPIVPLPISTRAIGFYTTEIFEDIRTEVDGVCDIFQAYRVALLQFGATILDSEKEQHGVVAELPDVFRPHEDPAVTAARRQIAAFEPIASKINAIGVVQVGTATYAPVLVQSARIDRIAAPTARQRKRIRMESTPLPEASEVTHWNLRATLLALEDPDSNPAWRRRFAERNAIPGLVFDEDDLIPEGTADRIWPEDYIQRETYEYDLKCFSRLFNRLLSKKTAFLRGEVTFSGKGDSSMLATTQGFTASLITTGRSVRLEAFGTAKFSSLQPIQLSAMMSGVASLQVEKISAPAYQHVGNAACPMIGAIPWQSVLRRVVTGL